MPRIINKTLRASANVTTATTETGSEVRVEEFNIKEIAFLLDVTVLGTAAGDLLDVYIDVSPDSGTTWINIGLFTQVLGNASAQKHIMSFGEVKASDSAIIDITSDIATAGIRKLPIFNSVRYRGITTEVTDVNFTYSVKLFAKS